LLNHNEIKYEKVKAADDIPELVPPGVLNVASNKINKNKSIFSMILIGLVISLLLIVMILLIKANNNQLPLTHKNSHANDNDSSVKQIGIKPDPPDQKLIDKLEKVINQWLLLDSEAEQKHYSQWADKEIIQARKEAEQGDQFIRQSNYNLAAVSYQNAISILEQVKFSKPSVLSNLLLKADNAIAAEDWLAAKPLYEKALLIEADNKQALYGLKRSIHLPEVIGLYQKASGLLTEEKNAESIEKYNEIIVLLDTAVDIDREYLPAVQLIQEMQKKNDHLKFQRFISQGLKSIEENKYNSARQFLSRARELEAQDPAVKELDMRINAAEKSFQIRALRKTALEQEKLEQWPAVIQTYSKILEIKPKMLFALRGKLLAETYNEWYKKIDHIIDHPERLQSEKIRQNARHRVSSIREGSSDNLAQLGKLEMKLSLASKLIDESSIDVNVEFLSDNETQIDIYKIGRLGQFKQKTVLLKPGKYTVVGSRSGYRDVRLIININAKDRKPRFSVICKEMI